MTNSARRDDWDKTRSRGQHLTETEIGFIRAERQKGTAPRDVARTLKCSSRVVNKYFSFFACEGEPVPTRKRPITLAGPNIYRSDFEPS